MRKLFIIGVALTAIAFTACNDDNTTQKKNDMSSMASDSTKQATTNNDKDVKEITPSFATLDPKASGSIKAIIGHYLHVKNALVGDNADEAASGAKAMTDALTKIDKSLFTPEQKKAYDETEDDLREYAEHIGKSKLDHQREHFVMMSEDVHSLVKAFGGGQELYYDHCPMANNGKGAMWISEMKEIKNPYLGAKMPTCGTVEERINSHN